MRPLLGSRGLLHSPNQTCWTQKRHYNCCQDEPLNLSTVYQFQSLTRAKGKYVKCSPPDSCTTVIKTSSRLPVMSRTYRLVSGDENTVERVSQSRTAVLLIYRVAGPTELLSVTFEEKIEAADNLNETEQL